MGRLLPTEDVVPGIMVECGYFYIDDQENEFLGSIEWPIPSPWHGTGICGGFAHNLVTVRHGADTLAHAEGLTYREHPAMVTWKLENGARTFSFTGRLSYAGKGPVGGRWEYFIDMGCNLMLYLDGRPVPQDTALVHRVRSMVQQAATRRTLLMSLVDFIESFGANTREIMDEVHRVDRAMSEAEPIYLELRFEEALEKYEEANRMLEELNERAIDAKDQALVWIYLIEWLTVTGASLAAGTVLWTIMVRRRLYKEVTTTTSRRRNQSGSSGNR